MRNLFHRSTLRAFVAPALACLLLGSTVAAAAATLQKARIARQSDLPRFSYPLAMPASQLVEADAATWDPFAARVRTDLERTLAGAEIADRSTMRQLLSARLDFQELAGEYAAALATVDALQALEEKPASKLQSGLYVRARLQAAIATGSTAGPAYEEAFRTRFEEQVRQLPWAQVEDGLRRGFSISRTVSRAMVLGRVKTDLDPATATSHALDGPQAWELVSARNDLRAELPLMKARGDVLKEAIARHAEARPDIWPAREATLTAADRLTPVLVGIWDSGVDVAQFPNQLFTDPDPTASGRHGLAFDDFGAPSPDWLYALTAAQRAAYPAFLETTRGRIDLGNGIDSADAAAMQKRLASLSAEQMNGLFAIDKVIGFHIHGTHCAGIAVRGNPAARLVVARFNDQLPDLPFAPTEAWARQLGAAFQQMADYFRSRHVRVVNMSWGDDAQEFETWLSKTGAGADPELRRKKAAALFAIWRSAIETAIKSAPDTLFVSAAGNSDSDVAFIEDVPASLRLPNLVSVGAVNQAGEETSFTSHGAAVLVHANGFQVDSVVPGGERLRLSGTSMAAPNVVNLAAKLFALEPSLTPEQAIDLIRRGATPSADGRRNLMDENRSIALLKARPG